MKQLEGVTTSFELFEVLNKHRVGAGEKAYGKHAHLVVKIKKEVGDLQGHEIVTMREATNNGGLLRSNKRNLNSRGNSLWLRWKICSVNSKS